MASPAFANSTNSRQATPSPLNKAAFATSSPIVNTGIHSTSSPLLVPSLGQSATVQNPHAPLLPLSTKNQVTKKKTAKATKVKTEADTKAATKKVITTLPAYKGKTKVAIDFEKPPEHLANQSRSALTISLDQAIREQNEAEKNAQANIAATTTTIETGISDATVAITKANKTADSNADLKVATKASPTPAAKISVNDSRSNGPKFKSPTIEAETTSTRASISESENTSTAFETKVTQVETKAEVTSSDQAPALSTAAQDMSASQVSVENLTFEPRRHFPKKTEPKLLSDTSLTSDTSSSSTQSIADAQNIRSETTPAKKELDLRDGSWRFVVRGGYLHAPYSNFESRLQNGASHFALGLARQYEQLEIRSLLEIGHAMDQKVTIQNTRYVLARGEAVWIFSLNNNVQPFISGALALGNFTVQSYRSVTASEIVLKRHAQMTALGIAPGAGFRFGLFKGAAIDLTMDYLALAGSAGAKDLGGLNTSLSFSKTF